MLVSWSLEFSSSFCDRKSFICFLKRERQKHNFCLSFSFQAFGFLVSFGFVFEQLWSFYQFVLLGLREICFLIFFRLHCRVGFFTLKRNTFAYIVSTHRIFHRHFCIRLLCIISILSVFRFWVCVDCLWKEEKSILLIWVFRRTK